MKTKKKSMQKRLMVYWIYYLFLLIFCLPNSMMAPLAFAHSPATMTVSYDLGNQDLQVNISHQVSSPINHYITKIEIKKNGEIYNTSLYTSQPTTNSFSYSYKINASTGDVIDVYALCNQGGSKTAQIIVGKDNNENETSTPGFELIFFLGAVTLSIILLRKKYS